MRILTHFQGAVTPPFDQWTWRGVCDPADPVTAEVVVTGFSDCHEILITIRGGVGSIDPAVEAAQAALDCWTEAIAREASGGRAA
jgi:hypothetical protein